MAINENIDYLNLVFHDAKTSQSLIKDRGFYAVYIVILINMFRFK